MSSTIIFQINAPFKDMLYDAGSESWTFFFMEGIYAASSGFWRLLKDQEIILVSLDHNHRFGLPEPIDMVSETTKRLVGHTLLQIETLEGAGDLKLTLTDGYVIQLFISSSGYETVFFGILGKQYIGMGGGTYAIMDQF